MNRRTQKIVMASLFTALTCVATMLVRIPLPFKGYVNFGDCIVLLAGWTLSPFYAFFAAGVGSALADVLAGYVIYAPATLVIKGLMALAAFWVCKTFGKSQKGIVSRISGALVAEIIMVLGYYIFEGFLYGFGASLVSVPANALQGAFGIVAGTALAKVLQKIKIK